MRPGWAVAGGLVGLLLLGPAAPALAVTHRVEAGECLLRILRRARLQPLYGRDGALARTVALNPTMADPNRILVGQLVVLPPSSAAASQDLPPPARQVANIAPVVSPPDPHPPRPAPAPPAAAPLPAARGPSDVERAGRALCRLRLLAGPTYTMTRLDAADPKRGGRARLVSLLGPGFQLAAESKAAAALNLYAQLAASTLFFAAPRGADTLAATNASVFGMVIGASLRLGPRLAVGLGGGVSRSLFISAAAVDIPTLTPAWQPKGTTWVSWRPCEGQRWRLALSLRAELMGGPARLGLGAVAGGQAALRWQLPASSLLETRVGYALSRQNTDLTLQHGQALEAAVLLAVPLL